MKNLIEENQDASVSNNPVGRGTYELVIIYWFCENAYLIINTLLSKLWHVWQDNRQIYELLFYSLSTKCLVCSQEYWNILPSLFH